MKKSNEYFFRLKKAINILVCICLLMSVLFFVYWLVISMHIVIPPFINAFFMFFNNIIEAGIKGSPVYDKLVILIPIIVSFIFIILTYALNCLSTYVETTHKQYIEYQNRQKKLLEETINNQLKQAFITELSNSNYILIKLKIDVSEQESYLHQYDDPINLDILKKKITGEILEKTSSPYITDKGLDRTNVYFLTTSPAHSPEVFKVIVDNSIDVIGKNMNDRVGVSFFCGAELYDTEQETPEKLATLERVLNLGLKNRIIVPGRFKTYFSELYPDFFTFKNAGEYNLVGTTYKSAYTSVYALQRKKRF